MTSSHYDHISLRNISAVLNIQPDPWHRENQPQPARISVKIAYPIELMQQTAKKDDVRYTLNYGDLYREIVARLAQKSETGPTPVHELASEVVDVCFLQLRTTLKPFVKEAFYASFVHEATVEVSVHLPKGVLRADGGITYSIVRTAPATYYSKQKWTIHDMRCYCILGINTHERLEKQRVSISLDFTKGNETLNDIQRMTAALAQTVENSTFQTVEALAKHICDKAFDAFTIDELTVSIEKPSAISMAECSIVEITRHSPNSI